MKNEFTWQFANQYAGRLMWRGGLVLLPLSALGMLPVWGRDADTVGLVGDYSWGSARISHILRNPFYKGAHLVCRTHQKGIRSNTYDIIPREDWEVIEGCHEAIVTPEEWEQVQEIIDRRPTIMKGNACPFYNLFHGLVYCATCGKSMQVRYDLRYWPYTPHWPSV